MDFLPQRGRIRFVLVSPSHPGNIGSAARAIKTMGFNRLYVVSPRHPEYRTDLDFYPCGRCPAKQRLH